MGSLGPADLTAPIPYRAVARHPNQCGTGYVSSGAHEGGGGVPPVEHLVEACIHGWVTPSRTWPSAHLVRIIEGEGVRHGERRLRTIRGPDD